MASALILRQVNSRVRGWAGDGIATVEGFVTTSRGEGICFLEFCSWSRSLPSGSCNEGLGVDSLGVSRFSKCRSAIDINTRWYISFLISAGSFVRNAQSSCGSIGPSCGSRFGSGCGGTLNVRSFFF